MDTISRILEAGLTRQTTPVVADQSGWDLTSSLEREPSFARYESLEEIGHGGMGRVLSGFDRQLQRWVAIKVIAPAVPISPEARARFLQEAQVTGQLVHPNIVPVHEVGITTEGELYFTMDRVDGLSLREVLNQTERPADYPLDRRLRDFLKVLEAVGYAHTREVIHRDLKPENIMLGPFGEVYVMDWGLARIPRPTTEGDGLGDEPADRTQAGTLIGTPMYMSPEQARGEVDQINFASDIYSLGAILYELVALHPPFLGRQTDVVLEQVLAGQIRPLPEQRDRKVPPELEAVMTKAMALSASDRFPTIREFRSEIESFLAGQPLRTYEYRLWQRIAKGLRRRPVWSGATLAVLLTALSLLLVQFTRVRIAEQRAWAEASSNLEKLETQQRWTEAESFLASGEGWPASRLLTINERQSFAQHLASQQQVVDGWSRLHELRPNDSATREQLAQSLLRLGELATLGQDFTLAEFALRRAKELTPGSAQEALSRVVAARGAREVLALGRLRQFLTQLERGEIHPIDHRSIYEQAKVELTSYDYPSLVDELVAELESINQHLAEGLRARFLATGEEDGLAEAVDDWLRQGLPIRPLRAGGSLAQARAALGEQMAQAGSWNHRPGRARQLLAEIEDDLLDWPEGTTRFRLAFVCELLALLGEPGRGVVDALTRYLWLEYRPARATLAGQALLSLAVHDPRAAEEVLAYVGEWPGDGRNRTDRTGDFWLSLEPLLVSSGSLWESLPTPQSWRDYARRAWLRRLAGDGPGAWADVERAIDLDSTQALPFEQRALLHGQAGRLESALADFSQALQCDPTRTVTLRLKAKLCQQLGQTEEAIAVLNEALQVDPGSTASLRQRGRLFLALKRLPLALADLNQLIELVPGQAGSHALRGQCYLRLGDLDKARQDIDRAIRLDPGSAAHLALRAEIKIQQKEFQSANRDIDLSLELDPKRPHSLAQKGTLLYLGGDLRLALKGLSQAIEGGYETAHVLSNRAHIHIYRGRQNNDRLSLIRAAHDLARACQLQPDEPWLWFWLAEVHIELASRTVTPKRKAN